MHIQDFALYNNEIANQDQDPYLPFGFPECRIKEHLSAS